MNRGQWRSGVDYVSTRYGLTGWKIFSVLLAAFILAVSLFFVNVCANISSFWTPVKAYNFPLNDLLNDFFNSTSYTVSYNNAIDILLICFCAVTIVVILLNKNAVYIGLKLIIALTITYTLRCTTLVVTSLPDSWPMGTRSLNHFYSYFGRDRGGDLIYSGHTLLIVTFAHVWSSFYLITDSYLLHWVLGILAWAYIIMVMIFIVVARTHYTIDVLLAVYIASGVWWSLSYFSTRFFKDPIKDLSFKTREPTSDVAGPDNAAGPGTGGVAGPGVGGEAAVGDTVISQ
ncbi:shingomyelin synthase [Nematocida displodere]|uniref:Shingomyelin synthase n=1 Tax=Nematocida displodere TaxID=1805483 RepID=A0A177EDD1_9MICR|nr:shingomyelin synthase [Nematocida displodere]